MTRQQIVIDFAVRGARARVEEIRAELEEIFRVFPNLRSGRRQNGTKGAGSKPAMPIGKLVENFRKKNHGPAKKKAASRDPLSPEGRVRQIAGAKRYQRELRRKKASKKHKQQ